jgi:hypothetical protein
MNFRLWNSRSKHIVTGLAFAVGPVLSLGASKNSTSTFGFFAGTSLHLWHAVYITPGIHYGEFADYPLGLPQPGNIVPSGFGTPVPIKRWTLRFGLGLTFKTTNFNSLKGSGSAGTP